MKSTCLMNFLFLTSFAERNIKCPKFCSCKHEIAICKGKEAIYIPQFPQHVTTVMIRQSQITSLAEDTLLNISLSPHVKTLFFFDNGIVKIHPNAFSNNFGLKELSVEKERKLKSDVLMMALSKINDSFLKTLYLVDNNWYDLPKDMFGQFINSGIENLHLTGNILYNVNCSIFNQLRKLKTLYLTWNNIETIDLVGVKNLTKLTLDNNHLMRMPQFCSNTESMTPRLEYLGLSYNFIVAMNSSSLQCLTRLSNLSLNSINLRRINNNTFANLPNLTYLSIKTPCLSLKFIEYCAFNSSSLQYLTLGLCFNFHGTFNHTNGIFAYSPNLIFLDLSGNHLISAYEMIAIIFKPLKKLETLIISDAHMMRIPTHVFIELSSLKTLKMDGNEIDSWNYTAMIFGNNQITNLSLQRNRIKVINETSFSQNMWESFLSLDLSFNPFSCTCEQMWFRNWMNIGSVELAGYPKSYICESPNNKKGVLLKDYNPTIESCTPWNPLFTMIAIVSSACVFVLIVIGTVCKCQTNIKNRVYLFRVQLNKRKGYSQLVNTEDFEYHAFVVYCEADSKWVHNEFLRKVEYEEGLKMCVHHRDFDVGEAITNNIDRYLQKSWKVVVVMSNNFAKSDWCQWEIDVVQERRRRQGKNAFLLIMLKNIDSKHMTSSLRTLLESTPHLTYQTGIGGKLFWKAAVETLRRPLGHPPTAVL